jgi:uncharacterized paraquat-inducible protein A
LAFAVDGNQTRVEQGPGIAMTLERCLNCRRVAFVVVLTDGGHAYCLRCQTTFELAKVAPTRATA